MDRCYIDAIAETRDEFFELVRHAPAVYYEVYDSVVDEELEDCIKESVLDELLLRFNMRDHSETGRFRFCALNDFECRAYKFPSGTREMPLPYFASFVPGYGRIDVAWTRDEVEKLINSTRSERKIVGR